MSDKETLEYPAKDSEKLKTLTLEVEENIGVEGLFVDLDDMPEGYLRGMSPKMIEALGFKDVNEKEEWEEWLQGPHKSFYKVLGYPVSPISEYPVATETAKIIPASNSRRLLDTLVITEVGYIARAIESGPSYKIKGGITPDGRFVESDSPVEIVQMVNEFKSTGRFEKEFKDLKSLLDKNL